MSFLCVLFFVRSQLPSSSGPRIPTLSGLLDPEYDDIEMLGSLGNYLPFENAYHPRTVEHSVSLM